MRSFKCLPSPGKAASAYGLTTGLIWLYTQQGERSGTSPRSKVERSLPDGDCSTCANMARRLVTVHVPLSNANRHA